MIEYTIPFHLTTSKLLKKGSNARFFQVNSNYKEKETTSDGEDKTFLRQERQEFLLQIHFCRGNPSLAIHPSPGWNLRNTVENLVKSGE